METNCKLLIHSNCYKRKLIRFTLFRRFEHFSDNKNERWFGALRFLGEGGANGTVFVDSDQMNGGPVEPVTGRQRKAAPNLGRL